MAFLVYFFVLLVMGASILFGLDWIRAPLHSPPAHQTHITASEPPRKSEPQQKPRARVAAVPIGRTQAASSAAQSDPETVVEKPAAAPEPKQVVAEQPPAPVKETTGATAPAQPPRQAEAKRDVREPDAPQATAAAASHTAGATPQAAPPAKKQSRTAARRKTERERSARVPSWAIHGAEAAQRETEERHGRVPPWALQGAEAARREAEAADARPMFRPFWVSRDEPWRW